MTVRDDLHHLVDEFDEAAADQLFDMHEGSLLTKTTH
jgi:hypothetical protein